MASSLRLEPHLRGHVAACNGRVELVRARAELCSLEDDVILSDGGEVQAREEEARRLKEERLLAFQRDVRERVRRRERARVQQLSEAATRDSMKRLRSHDGGRRGLPDPTERERVRVRETEPVSAVQRARLSLLSASNLTPLPCVLPRQEREEEEETRIQRATTPASVAAAAVPCSGERLAGRRYTSPGRLALEQRRNQAQQLHMFRRLYSQLERESARQRRARQSLQEKAEERRMESELQRRAVEGEEGEGVSVGSSGEERERLEEWRQTVALERRRHRLQVARETERYVEALRAQLRERLASCKTPPPSLCSCGTSLWDTDPFTCANNCPFYQNPRGKSPFSL